MHIRQTLNATSRDAMKDELDQQRLRCNLVQEEFRECFRECPQNHTIRSLGTYYIYIRSGIPHSFLTHQLTQ